MAESDVFVPKPSLPPPSGSVGVAGWMRANLFAGPFNTALTLVALWLLVSGLVPLFDWAVLRGHFSGGDAQACRSGGACWLFVGERFRFFIYGFYPAGQVWRVNIVLAVTAAAIGALAWPRTPGKRFLVPAAIVGVPALTLALMHGGVFGLPVVATDQWSGLTLTLVLSVVGIVMALPFGIVLALGRRSKMMAVRTLCILFIEVWRGVPLISVLFMASVMLPLFLPEGVQFSKVLRAMIGIVMFESAYMAEVVRGGLQAIPRGQFEAAAALGLGYWRTMGLVVLPQALKLVIPGIVNTFIALFKDTTLVLIIGLFDVLATVHATIVDPAWPAIAIEGYLFAALVFWVFCFGMSRYSQALERKLHTGHKRN
ncbi:amino acid ABC transporter permease [Oleispirillum naphthae]|uniref:amino acid ABC transporter permease n=1 Tax=Oleispirillum naphthae TaxID=2838853 RepID=UPI0030826BCF